MCQVPWLRGYVVTRLHGPEKGIVEPCNLVTEWSCGYMVTQSFYSLTMCQVPWLRGYAVTRLHSHLQCTGKITKIRAPLSIDLQ